MGEIPEITPVEFKERVERGDPLVVVDVREAMEVEIADLPQYGPLRIPVNEFVTRMDELDRDTEIVVYCRSGGRSGWAVQQLMNAGYERVLNLKGGILGWRAEVDPSLTAY
jgi:rhodanese-related sulfurtransferase